MKKQRSKTHCHVDLALPKSSRRPIASMHAPDLFVNGKLWKGRSIMDFMPSAKRPRKSTASER
jgi:hypothetical protein